MNPRLLLLAILIAALFVLVVPLIEGSGPVEPRD
jgi:hypothetical protein